MTFTLKKYLLFAFFILFSATLFAPQVCAQTTKKVEWLSSVATKADEISGTLRTVVGGSLLTLGIVVLGYMGWSGRWNKQYCYGLIAFAVLLTFADKIATWALTLSTTG